jgi:hypothetical protein
LIDVSIATDRNVVKKEAEKILKNKDVLIVIQGMWNEDDTGNYIGATGSLSQSFQKYLEDIPPS